MSLWDDKGLTNSAGIVKILAALAVDKTVVVTATDLSAGERLATSAHTAACTQHHKLNPTKTLPEPRWTDPEMIRLTLSSTQWQKNTGQRQEKWNQSRSSHDKTSTEQPTLIKTPVCLKKKTWYDHKTLKLVCHHQSRLHAERDLPKRSVFLNSPCSVLRHFVSFILYGSWISPVG